MSKATAAPAANTDVVADAAVPAKTFGAIGRDRWSMAGVRWNHHELVAEAGTPFERLLAPDYWANLTQWVKPGDTVRVMPEDGAYVAEILVWATGQNWAQVTGHWKADRPDFGAAPGGAEDDFEIGFAGPIKKHRIIRKKDRSEVKAGFDSPEAARRYLDDHRKALRS